MRILMISLNKFSHVILAVTLILIFCSLTSCSTNPQQYLDSGDEYLKAGQTDEAIAQYNKALEINPELAKAYYTRGMAYRSEEKINEALQDFNKAIEINPDYAVAYHARSLVYSLLGKGDLAVQDMNHAIGLDGNVVRGIDPGMALAYYKLGVAYLNMGNYLLAQGFLGKSLKLEPTVDAYMARSDVYMAFNEGYHQAVLDLTKVIALAPDMAAAYSKRGAAYLKEGSLSDAKADFDKAISLDSGNASDYRNRAYIYMQWDDNVTALNDLDKALVLNREDSLAYSYRGQIRLANGEYKKALDDFTNVLQYSRDTALVMQANDNILFLKKKING
jgi:tetratricopeptide (TPR) repeat protein